MKRNWGGEQKKKHIKGPHNTQTLSWLMMSKHHISPKVPYLYIHTWYIHIISPKVPYLYIHTWYIHTIHTCVYPSNWGRIYETNISPCQRQVNLPYRSRVSIKLVAHLLPSPMDKTSNGFARSGSPFSRTRVVIPSYSVSLEFSGSVAMWSLLS